MRKPASRISNPRSPPTATATLPPSGDHAGPAAALRDPALYEVLALIDALRSGRCWTMWSSSAAVAVYGFVISLGGQPLFKESLLD